MILKKYAEDIAKAFSRWGLWQGGGGGSGYTLPIATNTVLGGVKIGNGVNVASDGTISVSGGSGGSGGLSVTLIGDFSSSPLVNNGQIGNLTDDITNYELLLVVGWAYVSSGKYEQHIMTLIPKSLYFEHATATSSTGFPLDWILNGSISSANRRIGFMFDELEPNIIKVSYKDGAVITHVFGIN